MDAHANVVYLTRYHELALHLYLLAQLNCPSFSYLIVYIQHHQKFISTPTAHHVGRARIVGQNVSEGFEDLIAGAMAKVVIDLLKIIETASSTEKGWPPSNLAANLASPSPRVSRPVRASVAARFSVSTRRSQTHRVLSAFLK